MAELFHFFKAAIEGREYSKFVFTRSLSDTLSLIKRLGGDCGFDAEDCSYADIAFVRQAHISTEDPAQALRDCIARGRGSHAVFRDPDGAVFGVLAAEGGDPPDTPVEDGDVFWLDLFSPDPARAAAFYAGLAQYEVSVGEVAGRQRTLLSTNGVARAGVARMPAGANRPAWLPYILVDDVPAAVERALKAGGAVVMAPRTDLLAGNLAVIADREGGVIGIVNWPRVSGAPR